MREAARSKRVRVPLEQGQGGRFQVSSSSAARGPRPECSQVNIPACSGFGRPHITFYRIALVSPEGKRKNRSPKRKVCTYGPAAKGYIHARAADVWDPDVWQWSY